MTLSFGDAGKYACTFTEYAEGWLVALRLRTGGSGILHARSLYMLGF